MKELTQQQKQQLARFAAQVEQLKKLQAEISDNWPADDDDLEEIVSKEYPFAISFDDIQISNWLKDIKSYL